MYYGQLYCTVLQLGVVSIMMIAIIIVVYVTIALWCTTPGSECTWFPLPIISNPVPHTSYFLHLEYPILHLFTLSNPPHPLSSCSTSNSSLKLSLIFLAQVGFLLL